jgi:hypothetical protein
MSAVVFSLGGRVALAKEEGHLRNEQPSWVKERLLWGEVGLVALALCGSVGISLLMIDLLLGLS